MRERGLAALSMSRKRPSSCGRVSSKLESKSRRPQKRQVIAAKRVPIAIAWQPIYENAKSYKAKEIKIAQAARQRSGGAAGHCRSIA